MSTSVMLISSFAAIRGMLSLLLDQEGGYDVIAEASSGLEALSLLPIRIPQLAILDLILGEMSGLEVLRSIQVRQPTRILIFTTSTNPELIHEAIKAQPHGLVGKWDPLPVLLEALRAVKQGARYFSPSMTTFSGPSNPLPPPDWTSLSPRERTIVQLVAEGRSSKEVAQTLLLSSQTVDDYRSKIMRKLSLPDLTALTRYAVRRGLVPLE